MHIFEQKNLLKKTGCHQILSGGLFRTLFLTATDCADIDWCASSDNLIALHLTKAQQKDQHGFSCAKKTVAIDKNEKRPYSSLTFKFDIMPIRLRKV